MKSWKPLEEILVEFLNKCMKKSFKELTKIPRRIFGWIPCGFSGGIPGGIPEENILQEFLGESQEKLLEESMVKFLEESPEERLE